MSDRDGTENRARSSADLSMWYLSDAVVVEICKTCCVEELAQRFRGRFRDVM
jgi:hypothetical protein